MWRLPLVGLLIAACTNGHRPRPRLKGHQRWRREWSSPIFRGLTSSEADEVLTRSGLLLEVRTNSDGPDGKVNAQNPAPGTIAQPHTKVEASVNCLPAPCPYPGPRKKIYDPCTCKSR